MTDFAKNYALLTKYFRIHRVERDETWSEDFSLFKVKAYVPEEGDIKDILKWINMDNDHGKMFFKLDRDNNIDFLNKARREIMFTKLVEFAKLVREGKYVKPNNFKDDLEYEKELAKEIGCPLYPLGDPTK